MAPSAASYHMDFLIRAMHCALCSQAQPC